MNIWDLLDLAGTLRYGTSTSEKERLARSRALPGAPADTTAEQAPADRYAAGYLFAQAHPTFAPMVQPYIDQLKTSSIPYLGGSDPSLQAYADQGVQRALLEQANQQRAKQTVAMLMASR